jgi:hypothetical protein
LIVQLDVDRGCTGVEVGASQEAADNIADFRIVWVVGRSPSLRRHRETCAFTSGIGNVLIDVVAATELEHSDHQDEKQQNHKCHFNQLGALLPMSGFSVHDLQPP